VGALEPATTATWGVTELMVRARRRTPLACLAALMLVAALGAAPAAAADPDDKPPETTQTAKERARERAREKADQEAREKAAEEERRRAEESAHDAAALVQASQELAKAKADLAVAQQALDEARRALADAREADAQAQTDLDAAVLAEERAERELADVEARITQRLDDLGRLARNAYQSSGTMGEWAIVLSSTSPNQLADRLAFLQSVGSAGNAVLAGLAEDRADLVNAQDRLAAAREEAQKRRAAAAAALEAVKAKEQLADAAKQQVDAVVAARQAAFEEARRAALEDRRQNQVMVTQSGALASRIVSMAAELAKGENPPKGTGEFVRPGIGEVTSPFGPRMHPILKYVKVHTGLDIAFGDGIVYAADDGVVLFSEYNVAYGNMTVIDHGKVGGLRIVTMYAHQAASGVKAGDRVVKGQAIGVVGSTGYSTGPHLHFEVRVDGEPLDPAPFLEDAKLPAAARD